MKRGIKEEGERGSQEEMDRKRKSGGNDLRVSPDPCARGCTVSDLDLEHAVALRHLPLCQQAPPSVSPGGPDVLRAGQRRRLSSRRIPVRTESASSVPVGQRQVGCRATLTARPGLGSGPPLLQQDRSVQSRVSLCTSRTWTSLSCYSITPSDVQILSHLDEVIDDFILLDNSFCT